MWYERDTKRDGVAASQFGMRNGDYFCGIAELVGRMLSLSKGDRKRRVPEINPTPCCFRGGYTAAARRCV